MVYLTKNGYSNKKNKTVYREKTLCKKVLKAKHDKKTEKEIRILIMQY